MTQLCSAVLLAGSLLFQDTVPDSAQPRNRHWEVPVSLCGLSFKAPADWVSKRDSESAPSGECSGTLKSKRYEKLVEGDDPAHFWMIAVDVTPETFEVAMDVHEIRREGDRWFVGEGAREAPAYEIKGPGWWGLRVDHRSIRSGRRTGEGGSFESDAAWVIISSTASRSTATFLAGDGADSELLPLLLSTVRFDQKK